MQAGLRGQDWERAVKFAGSIGRVLSARCCTGLSGADIGRLIGLDVHALLNLAVHVSPCDPGLAHKIERQEAVAERPQRRSQGPPRAGPRRSESGAPRALASEI
jgi:hypothetical protein